MSEMKFNNELHEDLFKLMILASNDFGMDVNCERTVVNDLNRLIEMHPLQFNDRSIAPIEYERFVSDVFIEDSKRNMPIVWDLRAWEDSGFKNKITFHFEEN